MISHPNCKINIGLHVTGKRPDGYHNIETVFYPVPLCDRLEIVKSGQFEFTQEGIPIGGDAEQNLCVKAYRLLERDFPQISPVHIHLTKNIPFGAGLGGGSSDAAFVLKMLNTIFPLGLSEDQLQEYARTLGSDCAFFIRNSPVYASQRGDVMEPYSLDLSGYRLVLMKPSCGVSTAEAYRELTPRAGKVRLQEALQEPLTHWRDTIENHFEETVFRQHPEIAYLKQLLYDRGALYAAMSGSGSTVFGVFKKIPELPDMEEVISYVLTL